MTKPAFSWPRLAERLLWVALAGVVLYRFVLPVPSAPLPPQAASARVWNDGQPRMVEFSAMR
jgi:hypothetical protein